MTAASSRRETRNDRRDRWESALDHRLHDLRIVAPAERRYAGDGLVEHAAHGEDVAAPVEGVGADDLRRHVGDLAFDLPRGVA